MDTSIAAIDYGANNASAAVTHQLYMGPVEAAIAMLFWVLIALTAAVGNMMVIVAVFTHPALYIVQNFLLVSLALADILVAVLVMPFAITTTLLNSVWIFGRALCLFYVTCDVLLCTASILHLVMIALDRFFAIHYPIKYAQSRNLKLVLWMIGAAWIISALISIPPLIGWNDMDPDPSQCGYNPNKGYIIYSSSGSFYIPLIILISVYLSIFISARKRLRRRARAATPFSPQTLTTTPQGANGDAASFDSPEKSDAGSSFSNPLAFMTASQIRFNLAVEHRRLHRKVFIFPIQTRCSACKRSKSKLLKESSMATSSFQIIQDDDVSTCSPMIDLTNSAADPTSTAPQLVECVVSLNPAGGEQLPSTRLSNGFAKSTTQLTVPNPVRPKMLGNKKTANGTKPAQANQVCDEVKQSLAKRQKISLTKERRAARTLLIVVLVFVICWLPFFVWYVLKPFCPECPMDERSYNFILWLGFLNSSLNPVIYTIFNLDFRKAFKQIFQRVFSGKCIQKR